MNIYFLNFYLKNLKFYIIYIYSYIIYMLYNAKSVCILQSASNFSSTRRVLFLLFCKVFVLKCFRRKFQMRTYRTNRRKMLTIIEEDLKRLERRGTFAYNMKSTIEKSKQIIPLKCYRFQKSQKIDIIVIICT